MEMTLFLLSIARTSCVTAEARLRYAGKASASPQLRLALRQLALAELCRVLEVADDLIDVGLSGLRGFLQLVHGDVAFVAVVLIDEATAA
jgi:hypothetical protein